MASQTLEEQIYSHNPHGTVASHSRKSHSSRHTSYRDTSFPYTGSNSTSTASFHSSIANLQTGSPLQAYERSLEQADKLIKSSSCQYSYPQSTVGSGTLRDKNRVNDGVEDLDRFMEAVTNDPDSGDWYRDVKYRQPTSDELHTMAPGGSGQRTQYNRPHGDASLTSLKTARLHYKVRESNNAR